MENNSYFILSRLIFQSAIWQDDPHVLKLFIWVIGNARHSKIPKKYPKVEIKRGELVTSLADIAESNEYIYQKAVRRWSRAKVSRMLNKLTQEGYIELIADSYGTHIRVCNYDTYQQPSRYKADNNETTLQQPCNNLATTVSTNKKVKKDKNTTNYTHGFVKMSINEYESLTQNYGQETTDQYIEDLNIYIGSKGDKYKSHFYTIIAWFRMKSIKKIESKQPIPEQPKPDYEGYRIKLLKAEPELNKRFKNKIIDPMKDEINEHSWESWIKPLTVVSFKDRKLILFHYYPSWIEDHYRDRIKAILNKDKSKNERITVEITNEVK